MSSDIFGTLKYNVLLSWEVSEIDFSQEKPKIKQIAV